MTERRYLAILYGHLASLAPGNFLVPGIALDVPPAIMMISSFFLSIPPYSHFLLHLQISLHFAFVEQFITLLFVSFQIMI